VIQSSYTTAECAIRLHVFGKYTPLCPFLFLQRRRNRYGYEGIDTTFIPDFRVSSMGISTPWASLDMRSCVERVEYQRLVMTRRFSRADGLQEEKCRDL
jgi:hypothetical protein